MVGFLLPSLSVVRSSFPSLCSCFVAVIFVIDLLFWVYSFSFFLCFVKTQIVDLNPPHGFLQGVRRSGFVKIEKEAGLESVCRKRYAANILCKAKGCELMLGLKSICCKHRRSH